MVTGTQREAGTVRQPGLRVVAIGGSRSTLDHALAHDLSPEVIISFGMGGALDPALRLGDWVIGTSLCGVASADCDAEWAQRLSRKFPKARLGACYADGRLIADADEKQALFAQTGAVVADMESHLVAAAATRLGIPFAVLRCISDESAADLPPAIAVAMRPDGGLALGAIWSSLLADPAQVPRLLRSTARFNRAFASLREGARLAFAPG